MDPDPLSLVGAALAFALFRALVLVFESGLAAASAPGLEARGASPRVVESLRRFKSQPQSHFAALRALAVVCLALSAALGASAGMAWAAVLRPVWVGPVLASLAGLGLGALAAAVVAGALDLAARALAAAHPDAVAARCVRPCLLVARALEPGLRVITRVIDLAVRPFGATAYLSPPRPPLEDLERLLVEEAQRQRIDPQGPKLIRNIFEMSERTAREVMVPRTEVVALDLSTPPEEILRVLAEHGHSRMPVYDGEIDRIAGILHARDLVPMLQHPELIKLHDTLRPAHFVPWSKPVGEILREMQKKRIHMALVVDEYGGFMGLVTLEDVLEVIVGDIQDEYDEETPQVESLPDGSLLVCASMPLPEFERLLGVATPEGEYETVGGFLSFLAGSIPEQGQKLHYGGLQLVVVDRSARQVRRIRVQRLAASPEGAAATR